MYVLYIYKKKVFKFSCTPEVVFLLHLSERLEKFRQVINYRENKYSYFSRNRYTSYKQSDPRSAHLFNSLTKSFVRNYSIKVTPIQTPYWKVQVILFSGFSFLSPRRRTGLSECSVSWRVFEVCNGKPWPDRGYQSPAVGFYRKWWEKWTRSLQASIEPATGFSICIYV